MMAASGNFNANLIFGVQGTALVLTVGFFISGRTKSRIYDGAFFANVVNGEKPVTAFPEKLHRRCSTEFYIHLWGYSYAAFFYPKCSVALKIHKQKSVKNVNFLPFVMTLLNCFLWCSYGIIKRDLLLCLVNTCGCMTQIVYIFIYLQNSDNKKYVINRLALAAIAASSILFLTQYGDEYFNTEKALGMIASSVTVVMFGSPLSILRDVIQSQNASSMSPALSLMTVLVSGIWLFYGYLIQDLFVQVPNGLGFLLGLAQLFVIQKYSTSDRGRTSFI